MPGNGQTKEDCAAVLLYEARNMPGGLSRSFASPAKLPQNVQISDFKDKYLPTHLNLKNMFIQRYILESYTMFQSGKLNICLQILKLNILMANHCHLSRFLLKFNECNRNSPKYLVYLNWYFSGLNTSVKMVSSSSSCGNCLIIQADFFFFFFIFISSLFQYSSLKRSDITASSSCTTSVLEVVAS